MNWTDLLTAEVEQTYHATDHLMSLVDGDLGWKPTTGENWMTMGQLLMHITNACGATFKGFVTGEWGLPEGVEMEDFSEDEMMPPAEALPSVASVDEARTRLAADKQVAHEMIAEAASRMDELIPPPWAPDHPAPLGQQLLGMVAHLALHKAQLFYYLKLQGKSVNTMNLFGMA